ncbi:divergent polysaccharide deacetylase family protein [Lacimicrobium alkaliphilum]|uniref:divergent polysaccharide deacetylase family protein n=1 Tax=Lacimicrobium alkaliphilum TaxID=1526571 RepID=UPI001E512B83|nr:divergent polysaccharide deacetylase family protein [Lacimicrobium alkaliphilum]
MITRLCLLLICLLSLPAGAGNIALIIDDMGYRKQDIDAFVLPAQVTFAILPHTPYSTAYAKKAATQNREVMLHMPMEALAGNKLGPGALTAAMDDRAIQAKLDAALTSVPHAIGLNNHMGSKLTQLTLPMQATMDFLRQQQLFFIDSRTTRYSKANKIATRFGVPNTHRQVFLDHFQNEKHMQAQFDRLIRIARKYRNAIGIAHPYPETLSFLQQSLPKLQEMGIQLIPVSVLMKEKALALRESSPDTSKVGSE